MYPASVFIGLQEGDDLRGIEGPIELHAIVRNHRNMQSVTCFERIVGGNIDLAQGYAGGSGDWKYDS
ncbi:MAG: hypothetical protein A3B82_02995 [Methylophilales bacterium RIFCSPHIGHO2_02_FULL_57_10]|nr:MAG: hypothetical protein A3B82_02995 [Methylophilales bacterium RIFCSPHIGHO2_02_FULL_57_10]